MFHVGQKVVCVDASRTWTCLLDHITGSELVLNQVYTVSWVGICEDNLCLRLVEIPVRYVRPGLTSFQPDDHPFAARRFRPLVERKTDISIFEKMLTPNKVKEPV